MARKAIDVKLRVLYTLELIRKGYSNTKILDELYSKYNISHSTAYKYIHKAIKYIDDNKTDISNYIIAKQNERLEEVLKKAVEAKNFKSALMAIDLINKLNQLYKDKVEVTSTEPIVIDFGFKKSEDKSNDN